MTSQIYQKIYVKIPNFGCVMSQRTSINCVVAVVSVSVQILKDLKLLVGSLVRMLYQNNPSSRPSTAIVSNLYNYILTSDNNIYH